MQFLALIYQNETESAKFTEEENSEIFQGYMDFTTEMKSANVFLGGEPLLPTNTATSVRVRDGKVVTTDGPFAETKEQLGGYYLLDCKDLEEAIACAAKIPTAKFGTIEVRPIMVFDR